MGPYYYLDLLGGVVFSTSFDQFFRLVPVRILVLWVVSWSHFWWLMIYHIWQLYMRANFPNNPAGNDTSSTAQGGGGSFKNRKPIGEVGCCESGMAEWILMERKVIDLSHSFSLFLWLSTCLPIYLLCIYLSIDLYIYLSLSLSLSFI